VSVSKFKFVPVICVGVACARDGDAQQFHDDM
jgi:hypothetical protein